MSLIKHQQNHCCACPLSTCNRCSSRNEALASGIGSYSLCHHFFLSELARAQGLKLTGILSWYLVLILADSAQRTSTRRDKRRSQVSVAFLLRDSSFAAHDLPNGWFSLNSHFILLWKLTFYRITRLNAMSLQTLVYRRFTLLGK